MVASKLLFTFYVLLHCLIFIVFHFLIMQNQGKEVKKEVTEDGTTVNKTEDVLIKVIRVIANLSINENVGPVICSNYQCVDFLLKVLGKASMLHLHHSLISVQICQCREI